jgi:hypothetical protein
MQPAAATDIQSRLNSWLMNNDCMEQVSSTGAVRFLRHSAVAFLLLPGLALGGDRGRALARAVAAVVNQDQPTITVLPAATGASLQSYTAGSASLSLGRTTYYGGQLAPGVTAKKNRSSMTLSSRFGLQVTCSAAPPSSLAEVTISLVGLDASYTVSVDGAVLTSMSSVTVLRCGSVTEHVVEVEVPKTRPAASFRSSLSFSAVAKY